MVRVWRHMMSNSGLLEKAQLKKKGLIKKAENLKNQDVLSTEEHQDVLVFDESIGISKEDQKEILAQIEKIAVSHRISSDDEIWKVKPIKKGWLLPFFVNIFALGSVILGLLFLNISLEQKKIEQQFGTGKLSGAEGSLIKEFKKEVDVQLKEKDKELSTIQEQMKALDDEKTRILSEIDIRVKAKEIELIENLDKELNKEREILLSQGFSEAAIAERLRKLELDKKKEFDAVLLDFKTKTDAERLEMEANFLDLKNEYKVNLNALNEDRQKLLESARKREQELRTTIDARSKELEEARAQADAGLAQAQVELATLNDQLEKSKIVEDRLIGLYIGIRDNMYNKKYTEAGNNIAVLKNYIDDPSIASLSSMQKRRSTDLFLIESLEKVIQSEKEISSKNNTGPSDPSVLIAKIKTYSSLASEAVKVGDNLKAEEYYQLAISELPEMMEANLFFMNQLNTISKENTDFLSAKISELEKSWNKNDYAGTLAELKVLLLEIMPNKEKSDYLYEAISKSILAESEKTQKNLDSKNASILYERANKLLESGNYKESIGLFVEILEKYPSADQIAFAATGIKRTIELMASKQTIVSNPNSLQLELSTLQNTLEAVKKSNDQLTQNNSDLTSKNSDLQKKNNELTKQLNKISTDRGVFESRINMLEREIKSLEVSAIKFEEIVAEYKKYIAKEDQLFSQNAINASIDARSELDKFLSSPKVTEVMPDFRKRIQRYEMEFQNAGQAEIVMNFIGIMEDLTRIPSRESKMLFLEQKVKSSNNEDIKTFLSMLMNTI